MSIEAWCLMKKKMFQGRKSWSVPQIISQRWATTSIAIIALPTSLGSPSLGLATGKEERHNGRHMLRAYLLSGDLSEAEMCASKQQEQKRRAGDGTSEQLPRATAGLGGFVSSCGLTFAGSAWLSLLGQGRTPGSRGHPPSIWNVFFF